MLSPMDVQPLRARITPSSCLWLPGGSRYSSGMSQRFFFPITLLILAGPLSLWAAGPENLEQEYQQVRKIALRDAKVSAAYEEADRKLAAKIVQIDPALAAYASTRKHGEAAPAVKSAPKPKPATAKAAPAKGGFVPAAAHGATHTVTQGETLGGIAAHYGVSVASLKTANHITDERKLAVGQVLTIPGAKKVAPAKKDNGWWGRLTS